MSAQAGRVLVGVDLETTGLDCCGDDILEIAMIAIALGDLQVVGSYRLLVVPTESGLRRLAANDFVTEMHTKNGLIAELVAGGEKVVSKAEAERLCCNWYDLVCGVGQKSPMLGANPAFDRSFLEAQMPALAARFHYRNLDVNSLWMLDTVRTSGALIGDLTRSKKGGAHRALVDINEAANQLKSFAQRLAK